MGHTRRWTMCMLQHAALGPSFWAFTLSVAIHVHNLTPRASCVVIQHDTFTRQKVSLAHNRNFGCYLSQSSSVDRMWTLPADKASLLIMRLTARLGRFLFPTPELRPQVAAPRSMNTGDLYRQLPSPRGVPQTIDADYDDISTTFVPRALRMGKAQGVVLAF